MQHTTFLVVDDHSSMRLIVAGCLAQAGNPRVIQAQNGAEALARIERGCIDFVISDWNMGTMNGIELLRRVRNSERWAHLPFLLATADAAKANILEAARLGADGYLVKPFQPAALVEKVKAVLRKREGY